MPKRDLRQTELCFLGDSISHFILFALEQRVEGLTQSLFPDLH